MHTLKAPDYNVAPGTIEKGVMCVLRDARRNRSELQ